MQMKYHGQDLALRGSSAPTGNAEASQEGWHKLIVRRRCRCNARGVLRFPKSVPWILEFGDEHDLVPDSGLLEETVTRSLTPEHWMLSRVVTSLSTCRIADLGYLCYQDKGV